jgi:hypothetical protein
LRGGGGQVLNTTIFNTRFDGVTNDQRLDTSYWSGGMTEVEHLTIEPYNGITLLAHQIDNMSHSEFGSVDYPGLMYLTGGPNDLHSSIDVHGSIFSMGDLETGSSVDIYFDPAYYGILPLWFVEELLGGVSGNMQILSWREFAPPTS